MARQARIHSVPARGRAAFLHRPHAVDGKREGEARERPAVQLPRIQLHDHAGLRFRGALPPLRLPAAIERFGSMGQHRGRHRSRPPGREHTIVRADDAAHHHVVRREDGQDGGRRGVAQPRHALALRLLAVLAQHGRRRCRPLPAALHRPAGQRNRAAGKPSGRGAERREESAGHGSDDVGPRPGCGRRSRGNGAAHVRRRRHCRRSSHLRDRAREPCGRHTHRQSRATLRADVIVRRSATLHSGRRLARQRCGRRAM